MSLNTILDEISAERAKQDKLWGNEFDDKNTPNDWVTYVVAYLGESVKTPEGHCGDAGLDVPRFRKKILQAATLCVAAIEACDRMGRLAPRHYDKRSA